MTDQAREAPTGARYAIDFHSRLNIEAPAGGAKTKAHFDTGLIAYLEGVRAKVEAAG